MTTKPGEIKLGRPRLDPGPCSAGHVWAGPRRSVRDPRPADALCMCSLRIWLQQEIEDAERIRKTMDRA